MVSAPNRVYSCMSIYSSLYHFPDVQLYSCTPTFAPPCMRLLFQSELSPPMKKFPPPAPPLAPLPAWSQEGEPSERLPGLMGLCIQVGDGMPG